MINVRSITSVCQLKKQDLLPRFVNDPGRSVSLLDYPDDPGLIALNLLDILAVGRSLLPR